MKKIVESGVSPENIDRFTSLRQIDPDIAETISQEISRQNSGLELIASENFVSQAILETVG